jgi:hypothetical protein
MFNCECESSPFSNPLGEETLELFKVELIGYLLGHLFDHLFDNEDKKESDKWPEYR